MLLWLLLEDLWLVSVWFYTKNCGFGFFNGQRQEMCAVDSWQAPMVGGSCQCVITFTS
jgi:hypothetical protein